MCEQAEPSIFAAIVDALNKNSGAIQAVSTVVLVGITWWYARLTRALSRTAHEQLQESRATRSDQTKERYAILQAQLAKMQDVLRRVPEDGTPQQSAVLELMAHYDEFQHDLMKGATFLSPELREHIDKILSALTTLKEATRGVQPLSKDTSLYSARLPMINLK
ncbi:MAG: hypothetical protein KA175_08620, partial [Flavobacteriales bacterium]|nr:hypothetical protein [Flavobacteriales bacterium]